MPGPDAAGTGRRGQRGQRSAGTRAYGALRWLPHDAGKRNAARAQHAGRCAGTAQAALEAAGAKRAVRAGGRAGRAVAHLPRGRRVSCMVAAAGGRGVLLCPAAQVLAGAGCSGGVCAFVFFYN